MRWLWLCVLVGCGASEGKYLTDYTARYCELVFQCSDEAMLLFDGIESEEECNNLVGSDLQSFGGTCEEYDGRAAKDCLKAMDDMTCPAQGKSLDSALPAACSYVFLTCKEPEDDNTDEPNTTATPTTP